MDILVILEMVIIKVINMIFIGNLWICFEEGPQKRK